MSDRTICTQNVDPHGDEYRIEYDEAGYWLIRGADDVEVRLTASRPHDVVGEALNLVTVPLAVQSTPDTASHADAAQPPREDLPRFGWRVGLLQPGRPDRLGGPIVRADRPRGLTVNVLRGNEIHPPSPWCIWGHPFLTDNCRCGIYFAKDFHRLAYLRGRAPDPRSRVFTTVEAIGDVKPSVAPCYGYRASALRIIEAYAHPDADTRSLAERGITVHRLACDYQSYADYAESPRPGWPGESDAATRSVP